MPEKRQLCEPRWALFMAYRYQDRGRDFGQPEFMEWGLEIEAVAQAAMRKGLASMPWIPRQTLWQPSPAADPSAISSARVGASGGSDLAPPEPRRQMNLFGQPQGDLFDAI